VEALPRRLLIDGGVLEAVFEACRRAAPAEACGLLGGRDGVARTHYPVANIAPCPAECFEMDPQGQLEAFQAMRERGEELIAIYHSHPSTGAAPSQADLRSAHYPEAYYLIVGLSRGRPHLRAYRIHPRAKTAVEVYWFRLPPC